MYECVCLLSIYYFFISSIITFLFQQSMPLGLYFLEDLHVSRSKNYEDTKGEFVVADVMRDWVEQLMIPGGIGEQ
jgi:hypothetical protein